MLHCVQIPISFPSKSAQHDKYIHSLVGIIFLHFIYFAGFFPPSSENANKKKKN